MAPTFIEDIKPLFSQYDQIKMSFFCDLWNFTDVKANAQEIYAALQEDPKQPNTGWSLLPNVHVMPLYTGPWPQDRIAIFKAWIDGGCQPGTLPPSPPQPSLDLPAFIALSEQLTGFDDLSRNPVLAQFYFGQVFDSEPPPGQGILTVWKEIEAGDQRSVEAAIAKQIMGNLALAPIAQKIILLWYNATSYSRQGATQFGEQYKDGLVWCAILAHPMGYAVENTPSYWQYYPQNGLYTGAYTKSAGEVAPTSSTPKSGS